MGHNKHTRTLSHGRWKRHIEQSLQIPNAAGSASEIGLCEEVLCATDETKDVEFTRCNSIDINVTPGNNRNKLFVHQIVTVMRLNLTIKLSINANRHFNTRVVPFRVKSEIQ